MSIALVMIVKNESRTLPRLLASVRDHVDSWTIVDTGSTDATRAVIAEELAGIEGQLVDASWVNFGVNRAQAIAAARGTADYLLLADADFEYTIMPGVFGDLDRDAYHVTIREDDMEYAYVGVLRGDLDWSYQGVTHEYLNVTGRDVGELPGVTITHHVDGGSRGDKFERDLELLRAELERDESNPRTWFYYAQSLSCLGRSDESAGAYLHRAVMGGWDEEVYYSLYQAGLLLDDVALLLRAWTSRPDRLEALYEAAHRLRSQGAGRAVWAMLEDIDTTMPADRLFVQPWVYAFGIRFERALAAMSVGEDDEALHDFARLTQLPELPAAYRESIGENLARLRHCV